MRRLSALMLVFVATSFSSSSSADDWPRFRGPNGDGQSDVTGIPVEWQVDQYAWKKPLDIWVAAAWVVTKFEFVGKTLLRFVALHVLHYVGAGVCLLLAILTLVELVR